MPNVFDQFDDEPNIFDQFDNPASSSSETPAPAAAVPASLRSPASFNYALQSALVDGLSFGQAGNLYGALKAVAGHAPR